MVGVKGRSGGKKKPTALKNMEGTNRKDRTNPKEPIVTIANDISPPEEILLNEYALEEWSRVVPDLLSMGVLSNIDKAAVVNYCIHYAIRTEAWLQLSQTGLTYETVNEKGGIMSRKVPHIEIINQATRNMLSFASEFGMTPASRTRVQVEGKIEEDPMEAILNGKNIH